MNHKAIATKLLIAEIEGLQKIALKNMDRENGDVNAILGGFGKLKSLINS
tara:strand:+ start:906 stop:1055 length:150 start_codon:yes stop_codon:yes gene_type:complete